MPLAILGLIHFVTEPCLKHRNKLLNRTLHSLLREKVAGHLLLSTFVLTGNSVYLLTCILKQTTKGVLLIDFFSVFIAS